MLGGGESEEGCETSSRVLIKSWEGFSGGDEDIRIKFSSSSFVCDCKLSDGLGFIDKEGGVVVVGDTLMSNTMFSIISEDLFKKFISSLLPDIFCLASGTPSRFLNSVPPTILFLRSVQKTTGVFNKTFSGFKSACIIPNCE
jgi:hypothetical protein